MRKRILKYVPGNENLIAPDGKICAFGFQSGEPTVWIEVSDPSLATQELSIWATGSAFDGRYWEHVATAVSDHLVWHLCRKIR